MRVAVVEDDPDITLLYRTWFEHYDEYEAVFLPIDRTLFDPATWAGFDRVVLDLSLRSDITGLDVAKWLYLNVPSLKVIICTAYISTDEQVKTIMEAGIAAKVFRKPFVWEDLAAALE